MDNYDFVKLLQREMGKLNCDAKAEAQLALAIERGIGFDDILVSCDSLFCRGYNKDVVFTDIKEDACKLSILQLHLSRSGIYDHLPEGLFFQPAELTTKTTNAVEMGVNVKSNKQKEQEVRRFFLPFENDFFWQRLQIERQENNLLGGLQSGILNDYFIQFWGLSSMPKKLIVRLILMLPYANKIAGDISLTARCLEQLIQETVQIKKIKAPVTNTNSLPQLLGEQQLGADMICGENFIEDYPVLQFSIGPLKQSHVADYLEGGNCFEFLQTFYDFFVPVGTDIVTAIELPEDQKSMQLQTIETSILGYTSTL